MSFNSAMNQARDFAARSPIRPPEHMGPAAGTIRPQGWWFNPFKDKCEYGFLVTDLSAWSFGPQGEVDFLPAVEPQKLWVGFNEKGNPEDAWIVGHFGRKMDQERRVELLGDPYAWAMVLGWELREETLWRAGCPHRACHSSPEHWLGKELAKERTALTGPTADLSLIFYRPLSVALPMWQKPLIAAGCDNMARRLADDFDAWRTDDPETPVDILGRYLRLVGSPVGRFRPQAI